MEPVLKSASRLAASCREDTQHPTRVASSLPTSSPGLSRRALTATFRTPKVTEYDRMSP